MNEGSLNGYLKGEFTNKRVLVTGASGGIGATIAIRFGTMGASVGVHYATNRYKAMEVVETICSHGGQAEAVSGDLLDRKDRENLVNDFLKRFGGVDILVNNAGSAISYRHFLEIDEEDWDRAINLNAKAPLWLIRDVWPHMEKNRWGRIINISSAAVKYGGSSNGVHYVAAKAALEGVTIALAKVGAQNNILVNAIRCGVIDTKIYERIPGYDEERFRQRSQLVPLGRAGQPEEVAEMVVFLSSQKAGFITGELISVAGGD